MFVIFSPSEGFWLSNFGWSYSPEEADHLNEDDVKYYKDNPGRLAGASKGDVKIVPAKNYSHISFDELVERIVQIAENMDGDELQDLAGKVGVGVSYLGDSLFDRDGEDVEYSFLDVVKSITEELELLERESLADVYHEFQSNKVYLDDCEGFYHQMVM